MDCLAQRTGANGSYFLHADEDELPVWEESGVNYKLIAGEAFGKKSIVPVYSKLFLIEIKNTTHASVDISHDY